MSLLKLSASLHLSPSPLPPVIFCELLCFMYMYMLWTFMFYVHFYVLCTIFSSRIVLFPENSSIFSLWDRLFFLYGSCLEVSWSGVCAACCRMTLVFPVMPLCNTVFFKKNYCKIIAEVHPFFYAIFKSGIDKSTEWPMIPACPSLMCFFNRGNTGGTNSLKILCLMFVYVCFVFCAFVSGLIL